MDNKFVKYFMPTLAAIAIAGTVGCAGNLGPLSQSSAVRAQEARAKADMGRFRDEGSEQRRAETPPR